MNLRLFLLMVGWALAAGGLGCGDDDEPGETQDDSNPTAALSCADVDRSASGAELEDIEGDTVLSGVIRVPSRRITHTAGTVSIDAGSIFLMNQDANIKFGFGGSVGTIEMNGTATQPILFCGITPTAGTYGNIDFGPSLTSNSYLRNVRFEDGGDANGPGNPSTNGPDSALRFAGNNDFELTNVLVRNGQGIGINASSFDPTSSGLTITEMSGRPLHLRTANAVTNLPVGSYTGNAEDLIEIANVQNDADDITFADAGIPYLQVVGRVNFARDNHIVTFDAGVEYRFSLDAFMVVGFGNSIGTLNIDGEPGNPVVFTSGASIQAPGDWDGLQLGPRIQTGSAITHAEFRFGGKAPGGDCREGDANLSFAGVNDTNISVSNVVFADSAGFGVCVRDGRQTINGNMDAADGLRGSSNTFINNAAGEVSVATER
ncbi:MAG: hypothetical protein AAFZ38_09000 [Myxococcota bacterium]